MEYISLHATSGIYLQTQKCMLNTSRERTGGPAQQERIYRSTQNSVGGGNWGKNGSVSRIGPALRGEATEAGTEAIPTSGQLAESEEKHVRLRGKQLICGS